MADAPPVVSVGVPGAAIIDLISADIDMAEVVDNHFLVPVAPDALDTNIIANAISSDLVSILVKIVPAMGDTSALAADAVDAVGAIDVAFESTFRSVEYIPVGRPHIEIISDELLNLPTIVFVIFQVDGSVTREVVVDQNPLTPNGIPRVLPSIMDVVSVDGPARVQALWSDFAQYRWQYYNYERNINDCVNDSVVAEYAGNSPGQLPARPDGYTELQWTGIRFWLVIWWLYSYPSAYGLHDALACLGQTRRNRLFISVINWAVHYGPGHFEWYYPFTWLDHKFRSPFNLVGPGDYARLRIPRNLYLLTQHRLIANCLGDRNASRDTVIAHGAELFRTGSSDPRYRVDLSVTTESYHGK